MRDHIKLLYGGIIAVIIAFSLAFLFQNLWIGYTAAFVTAIIWLVIIDQKIVSKSKHRAAKPIFRFFVVLLLITQILASVRFYMRSDFQRENLRTIRTTIVESISQIEMEKALQQTLRHYYQETDYSETTLEESFRTLFSDRLNEDGTFDPEIPDQDREMPVTYQIASPDSIILEVSAVFTPGYDADFLNISGNRGMYEAQAILTKDGVVYERQN
ncbi:hypothetical protein [Rhodohalobacter barkolensis]|uniref:Uncharacterized protein n=1 Tax=Rhodohalobacter barkolensis TaxID=2053187 RepID=A0A2N0VII1_9BACT|nr:hypothetical protein [Rhodohalobacter barkolensis]PKD44001.1 hypothetical protein CWD77_00550 [Rhodohalobacter barkolensis]